MSPVPFEAARAWMFEAALPLWAERGVDRVDGGFYEELDPEGRPTACDFKRVRVMCRQIYVFSHGAVLGFRRVPVQVSGMVMPPRNPKRPGYRRFGARR